MKHLAFKAAAIAVAIATVAAFPDIAWADDADFGAATDAANQILEFLTGPIATAAGAIAIAVTGYRWFSGRMEMGRAVAIVGGIVLVLGSVQIVNLIRTGTGVGNEGFSTDTGAYEAPVTTLLAADAPVRLTALV